MQTLNRLFNNNSESKDHAVKEIVEHFYYTQWYFGGDDLLKAGIYHSTVVSKRTFSEMIEDSLPKRHFLLKEFDSEKEMQDYWGNQLNEHTQLCLA